VFTVGESQVTPVGQKVQAGRITRKKGRYAPEEKVNATLLITKQNLGALRLTGGRGITEASGSLVEPTGMFFGGVGGAAATNARHKGGRGGLQDPAWEDSRDLFGIESNPSKARDRKGRIQAFWKISAGVGFHHAPYERNEGFLSRGFGTRDAFENGPVDHLLIKEATGIRARFGRQKEEKGGMGQVCVLIVILVEDTRSTLSCIP